MAGTITHSWNGTVLTVTSDSGTSSADLQGTMGPRGPQGPAGVMMSASGIIDMNGYATEKWVTEQIAAAGGSGGGGTIDLSNYYTKSETDVLLDNVEVDLTGYATTDDVAQAVSDKATKTYVDSKVAGLATETFVTNKIAEAQLGGEGGDIDLTGYATKDDLNNYLPKDGSTPMTGRLIIQSPDGLWLDDTGSNSNLYMNFDRSHSCAAIYSDGDIAFTTFNKRIIGVANPVDNTDVANKNYVDTAIANALAALDGDEVNY